MCRKALRVKVSAQVEMNKEYIPRVGWARKCIKYVCCRILAITHRSAVSWWVMRDID